MTDSDGNLKRSDNGRFAKGTGAGPGRLAGVPNRTTTDLRELRREIAAAYHDCGGREIMRRLAAERPADFMRCVLAVLPREDRLELTEPNSMKIVIQRTPNPQDTLDLIHKCEALADGEPITLATVKKVLRNRPTDPTRA